jgi:ribosomal 30S subunit maturation factor RimM
MRTGMMVYGTNGHELGLVKEVRSNDFLVDRSLRHDVYVPFNAI